MRTMFTSAAWTGMLCGRDSGTALGRSMTSRSGDLRVKIFGVGVPLTRISTLVPSCPRTTDIPRTCTNCELFPLGTALTPEECKEIGGASSAALAPDDSGCESLETATSTAFDSLESRTLACDERVNSTLAIWLPFAAL